MRRTNPLLPPPKRRVKRTPAGKVQTGAFYDSIVGERKIPREKRICSSENVSPNASCRKGLGETDWKVHVNRSSLIFEREKKDRVKRPHTIQNHKHRINRLFRKIEKRFIEFFPQNVAGVNASVCSVELLLGDLRGLIVIRKDFEAAHIALRVGCLENHAVKIAHAIPVERGAYLIEIVHAAWSAVFCALGVRCSANSSRVKRFLRDLREACPKAARVSRTFLRFLSLDKKDDDERTPDSSSAVEDVELAKYEVVRAFERLCLCYNEKFKIRERRQFQPVSEWLLLGIPGKDPAHDAALYAPGGERSHWKKAILPSGGRVYKNTAGSGA